MERFKKIIKRLLFPHIAVLVILSPLSLSLLIYSFVYLGTEAIGSYVAYFLSAYTLTLLCARAPGITRFFKTLKRENKYLVRYFSDVQLRINLSLYGALIFNTAYAVFQMGLGFYHRSVWFYALAVYYVLLAVMRFFLLRYTRAHTPGENKRTEWERYRLCGVLMVLINLALAVIVFYIIWQNRTFVHHEITTIAMAAYTFTSLTLAIVNAVRYRRYDSPAFTAAKIISLAVALVSLLTLETTMLTAFGEEGQESFRQLMTGLTGIGVVLAVLAMAAYMIVRSTKELERLQVNTHGRE